jgi:hypothetical protein
MPTVESVYSILKNTASMSEFLAFCEGFNDESLMSWMGVSANPDARTKLSAQTLYKVFMPYNNEVDKIENRLDYNVRMLSSADYTLYAPNNTAMAAAYAAGLPTWEQVQDLYNEGAGDEEAAKKAKEMVNKMRSFVQYHFQNGSVFADQTVDAGEKLSIPFEVSSYDISWPKWLGGCSSEGYLDSMRSLDWNGCKVGRGDPLFYPNVMLEVPQ